MMMRCSRPGTQMSMGNHYPLLLVQYRGNANRKPWRLMKVLFFKLASRTQKAVINWWVNFLLCYFHVYFCICIFSWQFWQYKIQWLNTFPSPIPHPNPFFSKAQKFSSQFIFFSFVSYSVWKGRRLGFFFRVCMDVFWTGSFNFDLVIKNITSACSYYWWPQHCVKITRVSER